jgi:hypothetical protein
MAKSRFIQSTFVSGALSPLLKGRIDLQQYYQGVETARNVVIVPQGGMKRRAGTEYIDTALRVLGYYATTPTTPNGGTGANLIDFDDSTVSATTTGVSTTNNYVVAQYDLGASPSNAAVFIDVRGILLSSGTSSEFDVEYSDDASAWTKVADIPLIGSNAQNFRFSASGVHRYWRVVRVGTTDLGTATVTMSGFVVRIETATRSSVKLLDFSVEADRHYLLALTDRNIRIFNYSGTMVANIEVPFLSAEVSDVRDTQVENVMLLFHEDRPSQRLINLGTDTDWFLDEIPWTNIPQYDYNDDLSPTPVADVQRMTLSSFVAGDTFQLDIEGVLSKNITYAGDATADQRDSTVFNIQKNIQDMPVVGDTGVSVSYVSAGVFDITIGGESAKDFELFSGFATSGTASKTIAFAKTANGSPRKEDVWSSTRGYPKMGCFFENRLFIGGTKSKTQSLFGSKSGSFFDFDIDDGDDDEAIFATISSRKLNEIVDVFPGRNLQIFTSGAEFAVTSQPITPSNINIAPQTSHGASYIQVEEVDGATMFVDRNGKTLRDYLYSFNEDAYTTQDKSVLSSQLIKQPVDMAMLAGTQSEDSNWLFIVNTDGTVAVLNTLRAQDINGFTEWTTDGNVESVTVVDDKLFIVTKRFGNLDRFIEVWDFAYLMDSSVKVNPTPTQTVITGLDHLEGQTVQIVGDGIVLTPKTVASGQITLEANEIGYSEIELGINFVPQIVPMPINTSIGSGQNAMRLKRIVRVNMRVYETYGVYVDGNPVPIRTFGSVPTTPLDSAPTALSGIIDDVYDINGWNRDVMPTISVPDPTPFHIQAIEYEVESS